MFGIRGLDALGAVHLGCALAAMVLGFVVVVTSKGTAAHRRLGMVYAVTMVIMNATALTIYDLFHRWGPFHTLALVSLATVAAGVVPVWIQRPRHRWLQMHARFMSWSYAGLVGAAVGEVGGRLGGIGPMVLTAASIAVMVLAAIIINSRVPRIVAALAR